MADIQFFSKSAVDPFTSKTYIYPMKSRHLLAQKNGTFYQNAQPKPQKVAKNERRRLQTDFQFQQNEIKRLNEKYNVEMFSSLMRGGKAYAAEQKIREFRKLLFKSRKAHRQLLPALDSIQKKLMHKATTKMNNIQSQKYGDPPEAIKENATRSEKFRDIYDFCRLLKVQKIVTQTAERTTQSKQKSTCLSGRWKKKETPKHLYKSTKENASFFNREQMSVVRKVVETLKDNYIYRISKESSDKIIDKLFVRKELFVLNDQFV